MGKFGWNLFFVSMIALGIALIGWNADAGAWHLVIVEVPVLCILLWGLIKNNRDRRVG